MDLKKVVLGALAAVVLTMNVGGAAMAANTEPHEKIVQTAGRNVLGELAPEFARYNDDILFGEVWNKQDNLSVKTRSIITVTSLVSMGITDSSLKYHIQNAKNHGVSKGEMADIITQIGFYAGWPKAWAAFNLVKEVYADEK